MKALFMLCQRMKQYYMKNKGIFLLFLIGGLFNSVMVTYCYGNLVPSVSNRSIEGPDYMEYMVNFSNESPSIDAVEQLRGNSLIQSCRLYDNINDIYSFHPDYPLTMLKGTSAFTQMYQVIVPSTQERNIGEYMEIAGQRFLIIGVAVYGYHIPEESFIELIGKDGIRQLQVYAAERQPAENDLVEQLIVAAFPELTSISGPLYSIRVREARDSEYWVNLIIGQAFVAILSYTFLLRYLLISLRKENVVSLILGASKLRIAITIFQDAFVLGALANATGVLLHRILYGPVFRPLNIEPSIYYTAQDYCFIFLIMTVLSLITAIPVVLRETVSTPAAVKKRNLC